MKIAIIGAGLAGLSAAYHLEQSGFRNYQIFEKNPEIGGLCRSFTLKGFTFDYAIHILYSKDKYAENLIKKKLLKNNFNAQIRRSFVFYKDVYTEYPFQANLYGHEPEIIKECVLGLVNARSKNRKNPKNFEDWIYTTFGEGIAKHFMIPYNRKQWAIDPSKMDFNWIKDRVPVPKIEDVLDGALKPPNKKYGPNAYFWYPANGGTGALPNGFLPYISNLNLNFEVRKISLKNKTIRVNEKEIEYDKLISTIPLHKIVTLMDDVPAEIEKVAKSLEYNTVYAVNLAVEKPNISEYHWVYFPEDEFIFQRISFPMNLSPNMAPTGKSSITAEVSVSKYKPLKINKDELIERVIDDLMSIEMIKERDEIILKDLRVLNPAYIIYDLNHRKNVDSILEFLRENNIYSCGRFGEWEYLNMDHAILSGKKIVEELKGEKI